MEFRRPFGFLKALGLSAGILASPAEAQANDVKHETVAPAPPSITPEQLIINATEGEKAVILADGEKIPGVNVQTQGKNRVKEVNPEGDLHVQIQLAENIALKLAAKADKKKPDPQAAVKIEF